MTTTTAQPYVTRARFSASDRPVPPDLDVVAAIEARRANRPDRAAEAVTYEGPLTHHPIHGECIMFEHRDSHHTALPPPSARARSERRQPHVERVPRGTTVVTTVVLAAIVIVLALALVATMPSAFVAPTAFLFIAGLIAGSLVLRARATLVRRAVAPRGTRHTRRTRRDRSITAGAPS